MDHAAIEMSEIGITLITLGALLLAGLLTHALGQRTRLPRVTLLLCFGFLVGPEALDLLPAQSDVWFPVLANMTLVMIGFLLGGKFTKRSIHRYGRSVFWISISVVLVTATVIFLGLHALGTELGTALMLAVIATATAPAATADVVKEAKADGPFTRTLLGIVAVDDAWGLLLFSFAAAAAHNIYFQSGGIEFLSMGIIEVGGAVVIGVTLGVPMAFLTGRIKPGEPTLAEALGIVFLCGGLSIFLGVSFLLASMVLGAVVANLARHHTYPFHAIEDIDWPFMIIFFIMAGASLKISLLPEVGFVGGVYIILRLIGRIAGAWLGSHFSRAEASHRRWMGLALTPQAGVALGMALIAAQRFPALADTVLPVVIGTTVFFELSGPILTRVALIGVGEMGMKTTRVP